MTDSAACEAQNQQRVVFASCFLMMHQTPAPGHYFNYGVLLSEEVARRRDAMAAEIVHSAAAGLLDIPEVRTMWTAVRLPGSDPMDFSDAALGYNLLRFDDAGREHFCFRIAMHRARVPGCFEHGLGFVPSPT